MDPDGVPPLSLALRGREFSAPISKNGGWGHLFAVDASLGTNRIGVWGRHVRHAKM